VIGALSAEFPGARIVVVTVHAGDEAVFQAVRAGARGYLLKGVSAQDLLAALRTVLAGGRAIPVELAERLAGRLRRDDLNDREVSVLRLIARGLSNRQIGAKLHIAEDTAKWNVTGLLAKLRAKDRTHAVTLALHRGVIDLEEVELR